MKSIQNQYIDLKEGRMSQANFMRNVRMTLPQYVTNVTSFKDAVRILKNKAILTELGPAAMQSAGNPEEEAEYKSTLIRKKSPEDDEEEIQALIDKYAEEESGKYTKFDDFEGGLSEDDDDEEAPEDYEDPDMFDAYGMDTSEGLKTVKEPNPNAGKWRLMSIDGKRALANDFFDSEKDAKEYARKNVRTDYKIVKLKDERSVYRNIDEGRKKKEPKAELHPNQIHPQELRMGIKVELEHTDDLDKAKKIALDHLAENPFYYTALKLSGIESPSAPKVKPPVEKKAKKKKETVEMVDAANQMQKVKMPKLVKEAKFNAMPGEEPNATVQHAMGFIQSNPVLRQISDDITLQNDGENAILRYDYYKALPDEAYNKLELQFVVEEDYEADDEDGGDDFENSGGTKSKLAYVLYPKKKAGNLGTSLEMGASKASKMDAFKESLEKLVREVLAETFDGRDNLDEDGGFEQWKQALYKIVMEKAKLKADEIAIDDTEIKQYYQKGKTPEEVYFDIWQQDAGNFFSIPF